MTPDGFLNRSPVLLDAGGASNGGSGQVNSGREFKGGVRFKGRVLLYGFPNRARIRIHFLADSEYGVAAHLGDWDITFDSSRFSGRTSAVE